MTDSVRVTTTRQAARDGVAALPRAVGVSDRPAAEPAPVEVDAFAPRTPAGSAPTPGPLPGLTGGSAPTPGSTPATPQGSAPATPAPLPGPTPGSTRQGLRVATAAVGSLAGPPAVGAADADALRRLGELELGDMQGARQDLELIRRLQRPGETLEQALAAFEAVKSRVHRNEDADARDAFTFVRTGLAGTLPEATMPPARLEEMYLAILGRTHVQEEARSGWEAIVAASRRDPSPGTLPQVFNAFLVVLGAEGGDVDPARQAFREILSERDAPEPLEERAAQYARLAAAVGPRFSDDDDEGVGVDAYHFYRRLPAEARAPFAELEETVRDHPTATAIWEKIEQARLPVTVGVGVHRGLLEAEKRRLPDRSPSTMIREVGRQLDALLQWRRPDEALPDAAADLQEVRACLRSGGAIGDAADAFAFAREHVPTEGRRLFLDLLTRGNDVERARHAWQGNRPSPGFSTFENRLEVYLAVPPAWWPAMDRVLGDVAGVIPPDVDRDRAGLALLPVVALQAGPAAVEAVLQHLEAVPGASAPTDPEGRTARLEWLCRLVGHAQSPPSLDRALAAMEGPSAVSSEQRTAVMADLLEVIPHEVAPWEAGVDIVERLGTLDAPAFAEVAPELEGLARILPEGIVGTRDALVGVLAERAAWPSADRPSPARLLIRFAELYATTRSVPGALQSLHKEARTPQGVEKDGDWVIVGGIRVPRRSAVARNEDMRALARAGFFPFARPESRPGEG